MKTQQEIIQAMLELQNRMTLIKVKNSNYKENDYYKQLYNKMSALKFVMDMKDVIA